MNISTEIGSPITLYIATGLLLKEAEPEFGQFCENKWDKFSKLLLSQVDYEYFRSICIELKNKTSTKRSFAIGAARNNPKSGNNQNQKVTSSMPAQGQQQQKKKFEPPEGANLEEYVANLKKLLMEDGLCAICSNQYHKAATCFYLCPEKRPKGWKPKAGIWCYKQNTNQSSNQNRKQEA